MDDAIIQQISKSYHIDHKQGKIFSKKTKKEVGTGSLCGSGYKRLNFGGKKHLVHRIIFESYHKSEPIIVDHINQNRHDNRLGNLRESCHHLNAHNRKPRGDAKYQGVSYNKSKDSWRASLSVKGKRYQRNGLQSEEEAAKVRDELVKLHMGDKATLNFK